MPHSTYLFPKAWAFGERPGAARVREARARAVRRMGRCMMNYFVEWEVVDS